MIVTAIDIGGTFTDLIGFDSASSRFHQAKSLTTPHNLVQGIVDCLDKSGLAASAITELIHGSTTAINTLIERKGARTGLIVTRGTRDVYAIGRDGGSLIVFSSPDGRAYFWSNATFAGSFVIVSLASVLFPSVPVMPTTASSRPGCP